MPVTAQFGVRTAPDVFATEPAPGSDPPGGQDYWYGRVLLAGPDAAGVFVEDELLPLVASLCLQAPAQLAAGEPFGAYLNRSPGEYFLEPAGAGIRLHGSAVLSANGAAPAEWAAPAAELLPALHDCGRRALAFFRARTGEDPARSEALSALEALEAETAAALHR
ncbi:MULTISPECIES: hypothetical protein [Amycolatopsis]|uniref:Uncharacterized protein n=1 Tax=Amycolatopsis bullii TaxID=941987 RepID=A0ABQ3KIP1_9PSEU|nr:hypothetical protein [Amycolatopsis bullii]GHG28096.1 hypothetical protein GCM10017567_54510 [Amycolatopsis bullii]